MTSEERYRALVQAFAGRPGVGQDGRGFGASALKVGGRIFAMLSSRGDFVVKLHRERVDSLVASGDGDHFDPGHGRLLREWVAIRADPDLDWFSLAEEGLSFVGSRK
jgi:hypothetical protein